MRKLLFILFIPLFLAACGKNSLVHEDFRTDLIQVLEKTDVAYEENRELTEDEKNLLDKFEEKYTLGWFDVDGERYEMSDIEKEITSIVEPLHFFTKHDEPLASEVTAYEYSKDEIEKYLEMNSVPEELVGRYPTYEVQKGLHPQFLEDSKEMIKNLNPMVNERDTIYQQEYNKLQNYLDKYGSDGFEVDGTHYLHNEESNEIYMVFWSIGYDIDEGALKTWTADSFDELKTKLN